jgi:hypothetical protein
MDDVCGICLNTIGTRPHRSLHHCHHAFCLACLRSMWLHHVTEQRHPKRRRRRDRNVRENAREPPCPLCRRSITWSRVWTRLNPLKSRTRLPMLALMWDDPLEMLYAAWGRVRVDTPTVLCCSLDAHRVKWAWPAYPVGYFEGTGSAWSRTARSTLLRKHPHRHPSCCSGTLMRVYLEGSRFTHVESSGTCHCCFLTHIVFQCTSHGRLERYALLSAE